MGPESTISLPQELDAESRAWVDGLRATGTEHARALERLHDLLLRAAHAESRRRSHLYPQIRGTELDDLCRQAADDALNDAEIDVVAGQLQSTRGAVYKVLHDARTKLRGRLEREGHLQQERKR